MFLSDATFATEEIVSMGLSIKSTDDVRGFQFNIEYDTSHVLFDTLVATDIINQFSLLSNESAKGTVKIVALSFSGEKIEKGVKKLLFIKFKVRDGANFTHSKINISEAEKINIDFISKWVEKKEGLLCGNSIHIDRKYIRKEMPLLDDYLHYRMIDVSSFKEVIKRWFKPIKNEPQKQNTHLALDDIKESIEELRWYKENYFKL